MHTVDLLQEAYSVQEDNILYRIISILFLRRVWFL